jgi:hypothetical protein
MDAHQFGKLDPDPDPHQSGKLDLDPDPHSHQNGKQDPDPHQSEKVEVLEGQFRALEVPNLENS